MITILCNGSRGDIQPYLALATELKQGLYPAQIMCSNDQMIGMRTYINMISREEGAKHCAEVITKLIKRETAK